MRRRLLDVACWIFLGVSRVVIAVLPFRIVRRLLGRPGATPAAPSAVTARQWSRAAAIGSGVRRAAGRAPWRSDCYPQALTARALLVLTGVPHVVNFGVRRDDGAQGPLVAHAWVVVGEKPVVGGPADTFTAVASFGWTPRPARRAA